MQFDCTLWPTATARNIIVACGVIVAMVLSGCGQERPPRDLLVAEPHPAKGGACVFVVMSTHPSDVGMRWLLSVSDATVSHVPVLPNNPHSAAISASTILAGDSNSLQLWKLDGSDSAEWTVTKGIDFDFAFSGELSSLHYVCSSRWPNRQGYAGYAIALSDLYHSELQGIERAQSFEFFGIHDSGEIDRVGHGELPTGRIYIDRDGRFRVTYQSDQDFRNRVRHIFEYSIPLDDLRRGARVERITWDGRRSVNVPHDSYILGFIDGRALWQTQNGYAFEEDDEFAPHVIPGDTIINRLVAGLDSFVIVAGSELAVYSHSGAMLDSFSFEGGVAYSMVVCVDGEGRDRYAILSGRDLHVLQLRGDEVVESRKRLKLAQ